MSFIPRAARTGTKYEPMFRNNNTGAFQGGDIGNKIAMDFRKGAKFGRSMIPKGSLGRMGTDADIKSIIEARRDIAQGMSGQEMEALRGQAMQNINVGTEQARRRLAAAQARAGVRGATAGSQISQILGQGLQQQQQLEQNLIAQDRAARARGLGELESSVRGVREFDLAQAAKERFTELQTGLSFGQLGAIERGSLAAANATTQAARLSQPKGGGLLGGGGFLGTGIGGCFAEGTLILMADETYKAIEDVKLGEMTMGGKVVGKFEAADQDVYLVNGDYVSGSHLMLINNEWDRVRYAAENKPCSKANIYNISVENHFIFTENNIHSDFSETEDCTLSEEESAKAVNKRWDNLREPSRNELLELLKREGTVRGY